MTERQTDQPPGDELQPPPDAQGDIGPWILKCFNDLGLRFDTIDNRLDAIDKNLKWLNRLAWFVIACVMVFVFFCIMFVRPAIPFVLNKLFPSGQ